MGISAGYGHVAIATSYFVIVLRGDCDYQAGECQDGEVDQHRGLLSRASIRHMNRFEMVVVVFGGV